MTTYWQSAHVDANAAEVWAAVNAVYAGFLAGDRAAIDANISPDATVWDSAHEPLLRGKAEMPALPAAPSPPISRRPTR